MSAHAAIMSSAPVDVLTVVIRDVEPGDWPFIDDSWVRSLAFCQRERPARGWFDRLHLRIARLKERGAKFKIAVDPDDRDQILGWACAEKPVVHYCFVKLPFREQGIARQLLAELDMADSRHVLCSEWTTYASKIDRRHPGVLRRILP